MSITYHRDEWYAIQVWDDLGNSRGLFAFEFKNTGWGTFYEERLCASKAIAIQKLQEHAAAHPGWKYELLHLTHCAY